MVSNNVSMSQPASYTPPALGGGMRLPRVARANSYDSSDSVQISSQKAGNQPKFSGAAGTAVGAMTGGVIGGVAAAMIGFPSLLLGFLFHPLWAVALASPLLIPAGMFIGAMLGKGGHK